MKNDADLCGSADKQFIPIGRAATYSISRDLEKETFCDVSFYNVLG